MRNVFMALTIVLGFCSNSAFAQARQGKVHHVGREHKTGTLIVKLGDTSFSMPKGPGADMCEKYAVISMTTGKKMTYDFNACMLFNEDVE